MIRFEVFKNLVFRGYYSLEAALGDSKYSLKTEKLFISLLIFAKWEYCEIIKQFDTKDSLFSSSVLKKDKKKKDVIFSLEFSSLRSKRSFSEISTETLILMRLKFDHTSKPNFKKKNFKNYLALLVKGSKFLD